MSRLPDFLVVGAPRTGTTTLYECLSRHPQVFMSRIKEPHFFCCGEGGARRGRSLRRAPGGRLHAAKITSLAEYQSLFVEADGRLAGECTPYYLCEPQAAERIVNTIPQARIVIVLRDPMARSFSEHLMNAGIGRTSAKFLDALRQEAAKPESARPCGLLGGSLYYHSVKRYLDRFGAERVAVFLQEDMKNMQAVLERLWKFLGVRSMDAPPALHANSSVTARYHRLNRFLYRTGAKSLVSRFSPAVAKHFFKPFYYDSHSPELPALERAEAIPYFRDDVLRLTGLIGRDLTAWTQ